MMQFGHTYDLVMSGVKTQTRRVWQPGDELVYYDGVYYVSRYSAKRQDYYTVYQTGKQYAAQPGRGRKAGGRILLTGIRSERVQDITNEDALAEGAKAKYDGDILMQPCDIYAELWDTIHTRPGEQWDDNPLVWVLVFRLVEEATNEQG